MLEEYKKGGVEVNINPILIFFPGLEGLLSHGIPIREKQSGQLLGDNHGIPLRKRILRVSGYQRESKHFEKVITYAHKGDIGLCLPISGRCYTGKHPVNP